MSKRPLLLLLLALVAAPSVAGCRARPVATTPGVGTDAVAAHGYAIAREQLVQAIGEALDECGWKTASADPTGGVFVATKRQALFDVNSTLTVAFHPEGDRLRVDVTLTSGQAQIAAAKTKEQVWAFYDALDRRAGTPTRL
jgi:hypothetical protein